MTLYYNYLHHVEAKILPPPLSLMAPHGSAHSPHRSISTAKNEN